MGQVFTEETNIASAPEVTLTMMAKAMADLVNMAVSPVSDTAHPILACACIRKIGGWPDGPIKLQFRRLNSILCERRYVPSSGPSRWSRVPKPTTIKLDGLSAGTLKHQQA